MIQIPAFLCRQTDLVQAAAATGRCVNLKKGQFLSPQEMGKVLEKARATGNRNILLTERGSSFGYNNLVVDFRSFVVMRSFGQPVVFDVTHSVQSPGGQGEKSGGNPQYIPHLARAGAAVGRGRVFLRSARQSCQGVVGRAEFSEREDVPASGGGNPSHTQRAPEDVVSDRDPRAPLTTAIRVLEAEADAIRSLVDRMGESFLRAVDLAAACSGKIVVTGLGKSGIICKKIAATLSSTGSPAIFLHASDALHGDCGLMAKDDMVLAVSKSGETAEILQLLNVSKRLGLPVIAMAGDCDSTLAQFADVFLDVSVAEEACPLGLAPTTSTAAALAMGDALAMALMERKGFGREDFASVASGRQHRQKASACRGTDASRRADSAGPGVRRRCRDVIYEMSRKSLGMTVVTDGQGILAGVISDGDLRRLLQKSADPLKLTAGQAMTRQPKTISEDALATAALAKMEEMKITSLVVVDAEQDSSRRRPPPRSLAHRTYLGTRSTIRKHNPLNHVASGPQPRRFGDARHCRNMSRAEAQTHMFDVLVCCLIMCP